MSDNGSELSPGMDFCGDATPTAMDPYRNDVISASQQSVLNELRVNLCYADLNYLNEHKEVEVIAKLVLKEVLKNAPKNPWAHAARYLSDPRTSSRIANFTKSQDTFTQDILDRDTRTYATTTAMAESLFDDFDSWQGDELGVEQYEELGNEQDEEPNENQDEDQD